MLFTFPSQYLFTIGLSGVFSLGGWSPHIQTGFHVSRPTHLSSKYAFQIRGYHPLWLFFPEHSSKHIKTFGLIRFRSPLLTESLRFLFLRVLRCFSSPGLLLALRRVTGLLPAGLPHSDISGSIRVCRSPELFAAYHVLLRLWKPRHPPYALNDFFPNNILVQFLSNTTVLN